eukprot:COSAG01_NODE_6126_length_3837_cov_720.067416_2_plen_62_part_00
MNASQRKHAGSSVGSSRGLGKIRGSYNTKKAKKEKALAAHTLTNKNLIPDALKKSKKAKKE